jgi:hypothetical protein
VIVPPRSRPDSRLRGISDSLVFGRGSEYLGLFHELQC